MERNEVIARATSHTPTAGDLLAGLRLVEHVARHILQAPLGSPIISFGRPRKLERADKESARRVLAAIPRLAAMPPTATVPYSLAAVLRSDLQDLVEIRVQEQAAQSPVAAPRGSGIPWLALALISVELLALVALIRRGDRK